MLVQLMLVVTFIIFEEIVWEGFAKPIYIFIHELHVLQKLQSKLHSTNRYAILVLFVFLLVSVEFAGIIAGIMVVKGMVLSAILLYALKIPIAAFTFWLFRATEAKLLSFDWFKWSYGRVVGFFDWIKSRDIYKSTIKTAKEFRATLKEFARSFRSRYLSEENTLSKRLKRLYHTVKKIIRRKDGV